MANSLNANSKPKKHAAFAGNARSITGVKPLKSARGPSSRIISRNTPRIPENYVPYKYLTIHRNM